ncbi:MAG: hypothetical protein BIFFINMI_03577 [Phycisphaerae bacterium]|nr:hypothetical protein [Phycisphaerae bacterium]
MVWNTLSSDRGGYVVKLAPNSAHPTDTVLALCDHDFSKIIASTENNTLALTSDDYGLKCEIALPDTTWARDTVALIEHLRTSDGESQVGMSFGMMFEGMQFSEAEENGQVVRTFSSFVFDEVSITGIPAFEDTEIDTKEAEEEEPQPEEKESDEMPMMPMVAAATPERNRMQVELKEIELMLIDIDAGQSIQCVS